MTEIDRLVDKHVMKTGYRGFRLPCYSTDMVAAWEIVEKMSADGFSVEICDDDEGWEVVFLRRDDIGKARAFIAPAICLAALRALEVDEAEIQRALEVGG